MRILGLDPSSKCTGVVVVDGPPDKPRLVTGERLTASAALPYIDRVIEMMRCLTTIIAAYQPSLVVIEMPGGKRNWGMKKVNMASLSIYGVAAGALWATCRNLHIPTKAVTVNAATRSLPKPKRQAQVRAVFKNYRAADDPGYDVSDAAYLALTELRRSKP